MIGALCDWLFPWSCAVCRVGYEGRGTLCEDCLEALRKLEQEPHCDACAMPLPMAGSPCPYCKGKGAPNFERVVRLAAFHDPVRALIHHLKYHRQWGIGEELANRLVEQERVKGLLQISDVLVPVPLHWRRQITRGYNQAQVIARHLAKQCDKPVVRAVRRVKNMETQTRLHSHHKREENLRDAFALVRGGGERIKGKHVVVIDDVWTTGATMQAMARELKKAKPASLSAIVVASVDPRGLERSDPHNPL